MKLISLLVAVVFTFSSVLHVLSLEQSGTFNDGLALSFFWKEAEQCEVYHNESEIFIDCLRYAAENAENQAILRYAHRINGQLPETL
ncbi:hypothetical protein AHIS1_p004 [Acaryochloris phage A-HIS1]|nr:hypothetical protein AHIS1_p004 [Acaryochloris phage A-HIS1]